MKHDSENPKESVGKKKCPMHLLPPEFLNQTANVLGYGAYDAPRVDGQKGYGPWNWREDPIKMSTYQAAILRHWTAIMEGNLLDDPHGQSHFASIAANCAIILDAQKHGTLIDDRPKKPTPEEASERMENSVLREVTPGKPIPCAPNPNYTDAPNEYLHGTVRDGKFVVDSVMVETRSYRLLKKGEPVRVGDEIKNNDGSGWGPVYVFADDDCVIVGITPHCYEGQYRRRIEDT